MTNTEKGILLVMAVLCGFLAFGCEAGDNNHPEYPGSAYDNPQFPNLGGIQFGDEFTLDDYCLINGRWTLCPDKDAGPPPAEEPPSEECEVPNPAGDPCNPGNQDNPGHEK
jgi:hypothetical protein